MKILHVIPSISMRRGGPSAAALDMVRALRQQGVDAGILTSNDDGPELDCSLPTGRWCERDGVPVLAFRRWQAPLAPLREYTITPGLNRWLHAHLRRFDLLHVHALFSWPSTSAMWQARRQGVPYMVSTIGQLNRWSLSRSRARKRLMLALVDRANLEGAARLHFASEAERLEAADLKVATRPCVLPLGVAIPPLPTALQRQANTGTRFLFLSRIHPKKQLECLLEALALMQVHHPEANWQLSIAGTGDPAYVQRLQTLTKRLAIAHRCHWLGFLEGESRWQALQQADWFVLPSASENFGIAAIEAIAAGTPAILSREVAVAADIAAAGAGLLAEPHPQALASVLASALGGPPAPMRCAARALAERHYSWQRIGGRLRLSYEEILGERG